MIPLNGPDRPLKVETPVRTPLGLRVRVVGSLQCFERLSVSVDRSFGDDPLAGLSGDLGNEIEIGVVVQER